MNALLPGLETMSIATESDFAAQIDEIAAFQPDVFVIDLLLRWANPSPQMPPVPDGYEDDSGFYRAGMRCLGKLADDERTATTPVIIYSVIERDDIKDNV